MNEQTQLCTVQIGTSPILRTRNVQECIPQWSNNKLTLITTEGSHEVTLSIDIAHNISWLRLLRCSSQRIRLLTDPFNASAMPNLIRVYVNSQHVVAQHRTVQMLLEEEYLQEVLTKQRYQIELIDSTHERSFRKGMRVANERLRDLKYDYDVSKQVPELTCAFMRIRERLDYGLPSLHEEHKQTLIGNGTGMRQCWETFTFERNSQQTNTSTVPSLGPLQVHTNDLSIAEQSVCTAWKLAAQDRMNMGPHQTYFLLPNCMFVYLASEDSILFWKNACDVTGLTCAVAQYGRVPVSMQSCDVILVPPSQLRVIEETRNRTVQTLAFALRLHNETLGQTAIFHSEPNETRMRKLHMSSLHRWNVDENLSVSDLPLAWCLPGLIVQDRRGTPSVSDLDTMQEPNVILENYEYDLSFRNEYIHAHQLSWTLQLSPPSRQFRQMKIKPIQVNPDIVDMRIVQVCDSFSNSKEAFDNLTFSGFTNDLLIRGNLFGVVNEVQAETLLDRHFLLFPKRTFAQWMQNAEGSLRRRSSIDSPKITCQICFEDIPETDITWKTLCEHTFCKSCGPLAFRLWTPNHNASTTFVDCPACRTSLSSFDTLRIQKGAPLQVQTSVKSKAIENETKHLSKKAKENVLLLSCEQMPPDNWHTTVAKNISQILITDVGPFVLEWRNAILRWTSLSQKKSTKVSLLMPQGHRPSQALLRLLEN